MQSQNPGAKLRGGFNQLISLHIVADQVFDQCWHSVAPGRGIMDARSKWRVVTHRFADDTRSTLRGQHEAIPCGTPGILVQHQKDFGAVQQLGSIFTKAIGGN